MGFMEGARNCQHRWSGVQKSKPPAWLGGPEVSYRECSKCHLKVWSKDGIKNPPKRGIGL